MKEFQVKLRIRTKEGILDPESQAIYNALHKLGYSDLTAFEKDKLFCLTLKTENEGQAKERVREMANRLLANLVMEDFEIEAVEAVS